jgi:hypothetical protein
MAAAADAGGVRRSVAIETIVAATTDVGPETTQIALEKSDFFGP